MAVRTELKVIGLSWCLAFLQPLILCWVGTKSNSLVSSHFKGASILLWANMGKNIMEVWFPSSIMSHSWSFFETPTHLYKKTKNTKQSKHQALLHKREEKQFSGHNIWGILKEVSWPCDITPESVFVMLHSWYWYLVEVSNHNLSKHF
jgi:hypothetical protein